MTPLDEAPEQRWRRTVDRRNRPAKLKVDRLLRDFGYAELDRDVGDAIEARLAGVALAVAPSLRDASAGEVVTIFANDSAAPQEAPPPGADATRPGPPPVPEPAVAADVAQMVTYLKQQVLDARSEAERLRIELDRRIVARIDSGDEAQAIIAEQTVALEEQNRQIDELAAALDHTRQALADTRDEIRRAVGELQALPEPVYEDPAPLPDDDDDFAPLDADPFGPEEAHADDDFGFVAADERAEEPGQPAPPDPGAVADDPAPPVDAPAPPAAVAEPAADDPAPPAAEDHLTLVELAEPPADEPDAAAGVAPPAFDDPGELEPAAAEPLHEPDPGAPAPTEFDEFAPAAAAFEPAADLVPPPPDPEEFLPAEFRVPAAAAEPGPGDIATDGDAALGDDLLAGFDEFLYDADELYDPDVPPAADVAPFDAPELDVGVPDQAAPTLPPPPPPPPSPWADELHPEADGPPVVERPTLGKALRGRGGRNRGRWQGSCSVCGRKPLENRRRDLEAAGWDLDDEGAACPQCRGLG